MAYQETGLKQLKERIKADEVNLRITLVNFNCLVMGSTKEHELGQLFEINNLSTEHYTKKDTEDKENLQ